MSHCSLPCFLSIRIVWAPSVDNGCCFGHHLQWQASDKSKTRWAVELNMFLCYVIDLYKTQPKRPWSTPSDGRPRVGFDAVGGANGSPWWWRLWGELCWCSMDILYYLYCMTSMGQEFVVPAQTLIGVKLLSGGPESGRQSSSLNHEESSVYHYCNPVSFSWLTTT